MKWPARLCGPNFASVAATSLLWPLSPELRFSRTSLLWPLSPELRFCGLCRPNFASVASVARTSPLWPLSPELRFCGLCRPNFASVARTSLLWPELRLCGRNFASVAGTSPLSPEPRRKSSASCKGLLVTLYQRGVATAGQQNRSPSRGQRAGELA